MEQEISQAEQVQSMSQENNPKNYRPIFWKLFGVGMVIQLVTIFRTFLGIPVLFSPIILLAMITIIILWIKYFNQAWKAVGEKNGWLVGLIVLLPFGQIFALMIAHFKLKGTKYWV